MCHVASQAVCRHFNFGSGKRHTRRRKGKGSGDRHCRTAHPTADESSSVSGHHCRSCSLRWLTYYLPGLTFVGVV